MVLQSVIAGGIKRTPSSNGSNSLMWERPNPPPPPIHTHKQSLACETMVVSGYQQLSNQCSMNTVIIIKCQL